MVGCNLGKTIHTSSLGELFDKLKCQCCVNAFHGFAHNYACQCQNHPHGIVGMGIEDLETLERIFSFSNQLAAVTRYSSAYRRQVFIDLFFGQWDEEKYQNLGLMLYNNYQQALDIISKESRALAEAMTSLGVNEKVLDQWHKEEIEYFKTLGKEPEWDIHAMAYVELLQELRDLKYVNSRTYIHCQC
jgi:Kyakuja-Dileera-Zisupton transposase